MRSNRRQPLFANMLACAVFTIGVWWAPADVQGQIVMKVATVNAGESPRNSAAYEFARAVTEKSKGRIKAEVYINNQLARGEGATLEGVQLGTIDVAPVGSAPIGQELFKTMEAKGVKGLCFGGGWGFRNMQSNKRPIYPPDDMKGQTVRVQESPIYVSMMKQLGANPVPMPWGE